MLLRYMVVLAKEAEDGADGSVLEEMTRSAVKKQGMDETRGGEAFAEMFLEFYIC